MPPPIPLSRAAAWYSGGSQSGSARSSANRGSRVSQASFGDRAVAIVPWTSATKYRTTAVSRTNSSLMFADSDRTPPSPLEAVDAGVVLREPVAKPVAGDGHRTEGVLHVLEQDLAARDRLPVSSPRESIEGDPARPAGAPDGDDIEEAFRLASDELDTSGARLDRAACVGGHECGRHGGRRQLCQQRLEDALPERPVLARLRVGGSGDASEMAAEEDESSSAVHDRLVRHEPFLVQAGKARDVAGVLLRGDDAAPGDLERHPDRLATGGPHHLSRDGADDPDVAVAATSVLPRRVRDRIDVGAGDVEGRPIRSELGHGPQRGLQYHQGVAGIGFLQLAVSAY